MIDGRSDNALVKLRGRLTHLLAAPGRRVRAYDAIVSHIEVNDRHGVGAILRMVFKDRPNVLCVRSKSFFNGDNQLGDRHVCIDHDGTDRALVFATVGRALSGMRPRRVLCSPYFPADVWNGLVLKYLYGAPLCMYVMDDQSVTTDGIPSALMAEALRAADLRLAISQEMAHAYETKYGHKFWLVPPVVSPAFIPTAAPRPDPELLRAGTGVLVGNVWSARWLQMLRAAVRGAGLALHWYGDGQPTGPPLDRAALAADGIVHRGFMPQPELVPRLREYPYAILATSPLDGDIGDETPGARAIARLSLPSRLPFIMAAAHIPIIVLGSAQTTAARFVERFDLGRTISYSADELRAAVTDVVARQAAVRARAAELAPSFSAAPVADWLWRSLELGRPADDRYERLMPRRPDEVVSGSDLRTAPAVPLQPTGS
jgi:hypothetical protein